ncbi:MAG: histidine phosphatase family protein [Chitinophagaceae bacterium]|nr:MAG: histidine phosphatase family protein [Chitinophagaceae bacterium]
MIRIFCFAALLVFASCKTTTYYVSRHAEKEGGTNMAMSADPPLSAEGQKQAADLKNFLTAKNIKAIYSTNYARTIATAEPTRLSYGVTLKTYDPRKNDQLIQELKTISEGNVLVVGHSNTVDDIVNGLMGVSELSDLPETEYGSLFIVKKKGNKFSFAKVKVPQTEPR